MDKDIDQIWLDILDEASSKFGVADARTEPWLTTCSPVHIEDGVLLIDVPNVFAKEQISTRFLEQLEKASNALGIAAAIDLKISGSSPENDEDWEKRARATVEPKSKVLSNLNPAYLFNSFITGKSNRLAHAASLAVAESPGAAYNPLFIWGGVGLGKTHLMHAICHYALERNPSLNVAYASSEQFINEFIQFIRNKNQDFKNRYRNVDILLIDDIQFLGGKDGSQEEFFHTFNSLREANRQVVICSDRPPKSLQNIEDRLISRFEWGLVTDIQPPDMETRIAIIQHKANARNFHIPEEIVSFLAQRIPSNIRELEGALNRVIALAELSGDPVNIENACLWLKDVLRDNTKMPTTVDAIQKLVSEELHMSLSDLSSQKRTADVATARQIAMYLCREHTDASLHQIGLAFNKKDHTTVIHAHRKISQLVETDANVRKIVENIGIKL